MTAEKLINRDKGGVHSKADITKLMVDFAKYHIIEAEKAWIEKLKFENVIVSNRVKYFKNTYSVDNVE